MSKMKLNFGALTYPQFKEGLHKLDSSLSQLQVKSLFDNLKHPSKNTVEVETLIQNLAGEYCNTRNFKKQIEKRISDFIAEKGAMQKLKQKLEEFDSQNDGRILSDGLLKSLLCLRMPIQPIELERYIRLVEKDSKGRIHYQKLFGCYENTKNKYPLKAAAMRLVIFLKQNNLTPKTLLEKLITSKAASKQN